MINSPHLLSRRTPDLPFRVRLHPQWPIQTRRGVVVEVGFAQSLPSLLHRAELWLLDHQDQVHMVILVHIPEVIPNKYFLPQTRVDTRFPREKHARGCSSGEEVGWRWVGEEQGKEKEIAEELKKYIENRLLQRMRGVGYFRRCYIRWMGRFMFLKGKNRRKRLA